MIKKIDLYIFTDLQAFGTHEYEKKNGFSNPVLLPPCLMYVCMDVRLASA
jgi:hypothetical protein